MASQGAAAAVSYVEAYMAHVEHGQYADAFLAADAPVGDQVFEFDGPYQSNVSSGGDDIVQRNGICCKCGSGFVMSARHQICNPFVVGPGLFQPK